MFKYVLKLSLAAVPAAFLWWAISFHTAAIPLMETPWERFAYTLNCLGVAALFCLALGVESVAHDRFFSAAINPLTNFETKRMSINKRYLQNTLEQFVLFAISLGALTTFCDSGLEMRKILASALVWILSRFVFWIAYHRDPLDRIYGLVGMIQTLIILVYTSFVFVDRFAGFVPAVVLLVLFFTIEGILVYSSWKHQKV